MKMDLRDLATELVRTALAAGAAASDVLVAEGSDFSVTVRKGEVETLREAASKALGLRVFMGRRTAHAHTSDFSRAALKSLVEDSVSMARATGEDPAAGLPDETPSPPEGLDLEMFDPSPAGLSHDKRIEHARRAEAAALSASPEIRNSEGATFSSSENHMVLANSIGFVGQTHSSRVSLSAVPVAERDERMERDYWYTVGRGLDDLLAPEEVGRIAARRALRRLGARKVATCEVPVVFDPETAASLLGEVFSAMSGYAVFRGATFLKDRLGERVASEFLTVVDDARRPRGLGSRPFDGEGSPTRCSRPLERGVLRHFLCDAYSARKIGGRSTGSARRGVGGSPSVGASNLYLEPGSTSPEQILGGVRRGLYVTDLFGFGVNLVSGDYSQGASGHWIENGELAYPVHEITIAGNLRQMLLDVDAVGSDLEFRGSIAAPTLRISKMTLSGS